MRTALITLAVVAALFGAMLLIVLAINASACHATGDKHGHETEFRGMRCFAKLGGRWVDITGPSIFDACRCRCD